MTLNISNAILILGALWIHYVYGLSQIWTGLLVLFAVALWSYHVGSDEKKNLLKAEAKLYKAKAEYYQEMANSEKNR